MPVMSEVARIKVPLNVYIDAELAKRLDAWLDRQQHEMPVKKTAAVEVALREFLERREPKARK